MLAGGNQRGAIGRLAAPKRPSRRAKGPGHNTSKITGDYTETVGGMKIIGAVKQMEAGELRTGVWLENSITDRHQYDINVLNMGYLGIEKAVAGAPALMVRFARHPAIWHGADHRAHFDLLVRLNRGLFRATIFFADRKSVV